MVYILRYSIDAICSLEAKIGKPFLAVAMEITNPKTLSVTLLREVLHAGLVEEHPDLTSKQAGEIMVAAGGMFKVLEKVGDALKAAFPDQEASGTPRPQNRRDRRAQQAGRRKTGVGKTF